MLHQRVHASSVASLSFSVDVYCDRRWSEQPKKSTWRKAKGVNFWTSLWNGPRESRKRWEDENLIWCPKTLARVCSTHTREVCKLLCRYGLQFPTCAVIWVTIVLFLICSAAVSDNLIYLMKHLPSTNQPRARVKYATKFTQGGACSHSVDWAYFHLHTASHNVILLQGTRSWHTYVELTSQC